MAGLNLIQPNFNAGEWSPLLEGRIDLQKYDSACYRLENFMLDPRGPAMLRPGFRFIKATKDSTKTSRLIPFEFSITQSYMLEFGENYIRFYKDKAQILSGGNPYEVVTTYTEAQVQELGFCQSADVLYLFHKSHPPRKLSRTGHTLWTLSTINFQPPATREVGIKPATTLTLSAVTGTGVTATAGAAGTFLNGDVNRMIVSGVGRASITAYVSDTQVTIDVIDNFASTGPIASQSWTLAGSPGCNLNPYEKKPVGKINTLESINGTTNVWRAADVGKYVRMSGGFLKITSYVSGLQVKAVILKELLTEDPTTAWTLEDEVWSAANGYPSLGTFFQERLILAGSTAYPETVWGSVVGDYENFTPGTDDSDSFEFTLAGREVNYIRWIEPREHLIVGTLSGEWRVGSEDAGSPLTPLTVIARQERNYGSADIRPCTAAGSTLFVQRAGRKVREFTYQWEQNGYVAPDLTVLAEHVSESGIVGMVYQQEPDSVLWCWRDDGVLIGMTYLRDQDVVGWHRHPVSNGEVESMATIPGADSDEVWAIIKRTINGSTVRYVEVMEPIFRDTPATFTTNKGLNARFMDSMLTYQGAAATTITGLSHLEGATVGVLADGYVVADKTVSSGQIVLTTAATVVHVGLKYTGTTQPMRANVNTNSGTSQGKIKKFHRVNFRVYSSGSFKAGRDASNLDACYDKERTITLGAPYPLFTGDIPIEFDDRFNTDARIMIVQDVPLPLTVVAIMPEVSVS